MALKEAMMRFLNEQKILTLATNDGKIPWVTNVYHTVDNDWHLYFVSWQQTKHSEHLATNCCIAFGIADCNPENHRERIWVQGQWTCKMVTNPSRIKDLVSAFNKKFPDMADRITFDYIVDKDTDAYFRSVHPTYIKFWNDKLLEDKKTVEFEFEWFENEACFVQPDETSL